MDVEIRELRYFIAVAKFGTLTKAADELYVSQPTLTKAIQKLENTLGATLFEREKNQMCITDMGRGFLAKALQLVENHDDMLRSIYDVKNAYTGYVSFGYPPCTFPLFFQDIFLKYKSLHPKLSVRFFGSGADTIIKSLQQSELDLGVNIQDFPHENVEETPLFTCQIIAVVHKDNPLSTCSALDFKQLKSQPLCIFQEDYVTAMQTIRKSRKAGFEPIISCTNLDCDFLIRIAQAQKEIALIPHSIFLNGTYEEMVAVPFKDTWTWTLSLAWRKNKYLSYAAKELRSIIISEFEKYTDTLPSFPIMQKNNL